MVENLYGAHYTLVLVSTSLNAKILVWCTLHSGVGV
jgi:hypothetical protein